MIQTFSLKYTKMSLPQKPFFCPLNKISFPAWLFSSLHVTFRPRGIQCTYKMQMRGWNYADINRLSCFRNRNRGFRNAWREPETPEASKARDRQGAPAPSITGGCRKYQKPLILKRLETATWFCRNVAIGTWKRFWWNAFYKERGCCFIWFP